MDALNEKWNVIEKTHNFHFLLRLFAFSSLLDLVLAWATGKNLISVSWDDIGARPGLFLITVLAYGFTVTVGAAILFHVGGFAFSIISSGAQPSAPKNGVTQNEAQTWLENPQHFVVLPEYAKELETQRRRPSCLTEGGMHLEDSSRADKPNIAQTYGP